MWKILANLLKYLHINFAVGCDERQRTKLHMKEGVKQLILQTNPCRG